MTPQAKTIAEEMTEQRFQQVRAIVQEGDYDACAPKQCQEVHSYLVDGMGLLVLREQASVKAPAPKSWREWWWEFSIRAPWAGVMLAIAILTLYYLSTGTLPFVGKVKGADHEACDTDTGSSAVAIIHPIDG
jgi:hypothetical protein